MKHEVRDGLVLLATVFLTLAGLREAMAGPCKLDGDTCRTNRSCCGTNGHNGRCAKAPGAKFGACCTPTTCPAQGAECGSIPNGSCSGTLDCGECTPPATCVANVCCAPDCTGKECGDDGCGGSCGTCDPTQCLTCSIGMSSATCVSACGSGKVCNAGFCEATTTTTTTATSSTTTTAGVPCINLTCTCDDGVSLCVRGCAPEFGGTCDAFHSDCVDICDAFGSGSSGCDAIPCTECGAGVCESPTSTTTVTTTTTTTSTSTTTTTLPACGAAGVLLGCFCGDGLTPCLGPPTFDCTGPTPSCASHQAACVSSCGALGPGACATAPCTDCTTMQLCQDAPPG
jgi:hypothetical protein